MKGTEILNTSLNLNTLIKKVFLKVDWESVLQHVISVVFQLVLLTVVLLLINWIGNFLPFGRQKFVIFILYLVVTWIAVLIFNYVTGLVFKLLYNSGILGISGTLGISNLGQFSGTIWIIVGVVFIWVALFTAVNIYLLKRWTETIR